MEEKNMLEAYVPLPMAKWLIGKLGRFKLRVLNVGKKIYTTKIFRGHLQKQHYQEVLVTDGEGEEQEQLLLSNGLCSKLHKGDNLEVLAMVKVKQPIETNCNMPRYLDPIEIKIVYRGC